MFKLFITRLISGVIVLAIAVAAMLLGVKPDAALVVEDAEAGIQAAKAGGFCAAGIGPAANSLLADFRLQKLSDLLKTPA